MKKLIAYQKLLLNSIPTLEKSPLTHYDKLFFGIGFVVIFFMDTVIFTGNTRSSDTLFSIALPIICVWMINRIIYGNQRLFETVPVSRKYIALNVLLLPIVIVFISIITLWIVSIPLLGVLIGIMYLVFPQGFNQSPPESAIPQLIDTSKVNLLMICIVVIILFIGAAITFIKNKKIRLCSFAAFAIIAYGLLFFLKINMPVSPNSTKVEFLESFSVMPEADVILSCVAIATVIICITSCFTSYNLYIAKSKDKSADSSA
jgi:hypothetical protein